MKKFHFFNISLKSNYFGESTKPLVRCAFGNVLPLRVCPSSLYSFWNYLPLFPLQCYSLCLRQVLLMPTDWPSESWDSAPLWIVFYFVLLCSTLQSTLRSTLTFVHFELRARTWKRMPRVDPVSPISKNFPKLMFLEMATTWKEDNYKKRIIYHAYKKHHLFTRENMF